MKKVMLSPCCLNWQSQDYIHTGMNIVALIGLLMISQAVRSPGWNDYTVFFCLHNCDKLVMQISYVISNMYIQLFSLLLSHAESKVFHCRGTSRQRPVNFFLVTININHAQFFCFRWGSSTVPRPLVSFVSLTERENGTGSYSGLTSATVTAF